MKVGPFVDENVQSLVTEFEPTEFMSTAAVWPLMIELPPAFKPDEPERESPYEVFEVTFDASN
jgi:hypothetical protein